jgi:hypothetical protein
METIIMSMSRVFLLLFFITMMSACSGLTRKETNAWLATKAASTNINMTGEWDTGGVWSGGWGSGKFIQEDDRFTGTLGLYYAEGVVSGEQIYMVIYSGNKVYYTAILKKADNGMYMGKAVYRVLADKPEAKEAQSYLISLKKVTR